MYLSYYNLKVKPFQMSTDPDFLWLGEKHKEALAVLKYAIMENKGVLALTGDVGTGKTTLINALLKSLGKDTITATVYDARLDLLDFFHTVAAAFKIKGTFDGKGQFILKFMDFLIKAHERNQKVLLIIDEAQGINKDLLEEIRLLSNLEAEYTRLLNIFFVGQNEFIDILQKYENRALRQRVTIRYHINPLTLNETAAYIMHRLEVSGTTAPIFTSGAIDEIFFFSGGYPRLINIMCDHALLTGFVREVQTINANLIRECREELLVSKQTPDENFGVPAGNQQMLSREPMASGPSREPMASGPPREPMASDPPREPMASGPSREPMASDSLGESIAYDLSRDMSYVKDFLPTEDEQDSFGPRYSMHRPEAPRKIPKKRFFGFRSILIFLLAIGAGSFFYGRYHKKTASYVATDRKPFNKYYSMNETSKNGNPSATQARPDAADTPGQDQSEKIEDLRSPAVDSPNSGISKPVVPKETESFQRRPSKTFSQNAEAASLSKKEEDPESVGKSPAMKTNESGSLDTSLKGPKNAGSQKEAAGITTGGSDTAQPYLNPKTEAPALTSKKQSKKIPASDLTSAKILTKSSAVAAPPKNPPVKAPVIVPAPTIKENIRIADAEPAQIHTAPRYTKSAEKETVSKAREKTETAESTAKSSRAQHKTKEPETPMRNVPKKELAAASSSSEKKTSALFEKFKEDLSKKTVVSKAGSPAEPLKAANRAGQGTGEKIATLDLRANKTEKAVKPVLPYIPLMTRLDSFLKKYCRTYEQKDIDRFSTLFAFNAVEKGKPFKSWFPTYRQNFSRIDAIEYNIELKRYATQEDTGLVKVDGTFHIRAKLEHSKKWLKNSGDISMILEAHGNSFKVKELDY